METGIDKPRSKTRGSGKVEIIQETKCSESCKEAIANQVQHSTIRRKVKRKEQNVDKFGNNGSVQRHFFTQRGLAKQNVATASMKVRQLVEGKRKKISSQKSARKKRIESLKAKVATLKKESLRLSCELQRWATVCAELQEQITKKRKLCESDGARTPDSEKVY